MAKKQVLFPTGRIVAGNLYNPQTTDAEGRPLVYKSGANAGQPRVDYFFALAIAKGTETHWSQTQWGAVIWQAGHEFMSNAGNIPTFAWKVIDGDSQVPNKKGVKPCDREGYPGHWVITFSSSFAPEIYNRDGTARIEGPDAVNPGDYIQVFGDVDGNKSQTQPGVFINHSKIALQGYGERISFGADAASIGFGQGALPPGASPMPVGGFTPPAPAPAPAPVAAPIPTPAAPPATVAPSPMPAPVATAVSAPSMPAAPAVAVVPNPGIMTGGIPAVPVAPPVPPAGPQMTARAAGLTYEQLTAAGWTDAALRAEGYIV